jgi:ribulose bisphosphate carboxylase small subunit
LDELVNKASSTAPQAPITSSESDSVRRSNQLQDEFREEDRQRIREREARNSASSSSSFSTNQVCQSWGDACFDVLKMEKDRAKIICKKGYDIGSEHEICRMSNGRWDMCTFIMNGSGDDFKVAGNKRCD